MAIKHILFVKDVVWLVILIFGLSVYMNINIVLANNEKVRETLSSSIYRNIKPAMFSGRKSLIDVRNQRIQEISELSASYLEMEEILNVEIRFGSPMLVSTRKTKLYNIANLINILNQEVQLIDRWCKKKMGPSCDIPSCFGRWENSGGLSHAPCNSKGKCVDVDICVCDKGYTGNECQYPLCNGVASFDENVCSGRGQCLDTNVCDCNNGFFGANCQHIKHVSNRITIDSDGVRKLEQGHYIPRSCREYYTKYYKGQIGNGKYLIKPSERSSNISVECDMEGGGWMLINDFLGLKENTQISFSEVFTNNQVQIFLLNNAIQAKNSMGMRCSVGQEMKKSILSYRPSSSSNFLDPILSRLCVEPSKRIGRVDYQSRHLLFSSTTLKYWVK